MKIFTKSTVSKGKKFENQIAELYRLMSYNVQQNVGILGHQIDIILTFTQPGGITTKTAVECKWVKKGNLRKNDVMKNINALVDLKRNDEVQNLVIITTNGFAKDLWDTAKANHIELLTFSDIQRQMLDFSQYLHSLIKDFEEDEEQTAKYYVDLIGEKEEKMIEGTKRETRVKYSPIDKFLDNWLEDKTQNHLSILGEYGVGKTTLCRKYARDLAKRWLESKDNYTYRIPILISLREFSKTMDIELLVTNQLVKKCGIQNANYLIFKRMCEDGQFLLIFDGFDEMAQQVDFDITYYNFQIIKQLVSNKSKIILTCREEYFRKHQIETEILKTVGREENYDIIYIREFNDNQIKEYLKKRLTDKWKDYWDKINKVFDLRDLAKRPVLLNLIVKYLPKLIISKKKIRAASLYFFCIDDELNRKIKESPAIGRLIGKKERLKLLKLLANWMYNNMELELHYEKIPKVLEIKRHFGVKRSREIEWFLHDFLTYSFLCRDQNGNYHFSHRSFIDYFISQLYLDEIKSEKLESFGKRQISTEILNFLKEERISADTLFKWLEIAKGQEAREEFRYLASNTISLLNHLGKDLTEMNLSNLNLTNVDLADANLKYSNFRDSNLTGANLDSADLTGTNFKKAVLKNANLNNAILEEADFSFADLKGVRVSLEEMGDVRCVAFSPDGRYLASASLDGTVKVWDVAKFKEITTLKGGTAILPVEFGSIAFSPDGRYLARASRDGTIKVWDVAKFKEITTLKRHTALVLSVAFSPDGRYLASASRDGTIKVWDVAKFKEITTLKRHTASVVSVAFSPDGRYLAGISSDYNVKVWDVAKFKEITTLKGRKRRTAYDLHEDFGNIAFSPDGRYLASASKVWDVAKFKEITTLKGYTGSVVSVAFSPDSRYLARLSSSDTIKVWDVAKFKEIATLEKRTTVLPVQFGSVAFSPDGRYLASTCLYKTILIWVIDPESKEFGSEPHILMQQINCSGMDIKGIKGLTRKQIKFLKKRGAVN